MSEVACLDAFDRFVKEGYSVMAIDFLGHGKSEGKLRDMSLRTLAENVSDAINFLKENGFDKIGVYAISIGTVSAVVSDIKGDCQIFLSPTPLYDLSGPFRIYGEQIENQKDFLQKNGYAIATSSTGRGSFEISLEWIKELENDNGNIKKRHKGSNIKTLIVQGTEDNGGTNGEMFANDFGDNYFSVDGGNHNFTNLEHRKMVLDEAAEFFNNNL